MAPDRWTIWVDGEDVSEGALPNWEQVDVVREAAADRLLEALRRIDALDADVDLWEDLKTHGSTEAVQAGIPQDAMVDHADVLIRAKSIARAAVREYEDEN